MGVFEKFRFFGDWQNTLKDWERLLNFNFSKANNDISNCVAKAGDTMTGDLTMTASDISIGDGGNINMTANASASEKIMIGMGTYSAISAWAGGGVFAFGMNFYLDNAGNFKYKKTHAGMGARGLVIKYNYAKIYTFDMGVIATTANATFTPTLTEITHSGNGGGVGLGTALPATSGTMTATMDGTYKSITPAGDCTFNATGGIAGQKCTFVISTSGTSSYTLTFGTNFKTTGTLATGTSTGKTFTISFAYDGTNWCECSRTTAM